MMANKSTTTNEKHRTPQESYMYKTETPIEAFFFNTTLKHDPVIITISLLKPQQTWIMKDCCCLNSFHNKYD